MYNLTTGKPQNYYLIEKSVHKHYAQFGKLSRNQLNSQFQIAISTSLYSIWKQQKEITSLLSNIKLQILQSGNKTKYL